MGCLECGIEFVEETTVNVWALINRESPSSKRRFLANYYERRGIPLNTRACFACLSDALESYEFATMALIKEVKEHGK